MVGCRVKANCPHVGSGSNEESALRGGLSKGFKPEFTQVLEKTTENSERLGPQTRLGIKPDTSRLPVLTTEPLGHWWGPE